MSQSQHCQQPTWTMCCPESRTPPPGCPASHPRTTGASHHLRFPAEIHVISFRTPNTSPFFADNRSNLHSLSTGVGHSAIAQLLQIVQLKYMLQDKANQLFDATVGSSKQAASRNIKHSRHSAKIGSKA